jgi:hypothetical protein
MPAPDAARQQYSFRFFQGLSIRQKTGGATVQRTSEFNSSSNSGTDYYPASSTIALYSA